MTQDEIVEMAVKAGIAQVVAEVNIDIMDAFATLVAAKEREACAKIADEWSVGYPHPSTIIATAIRARGELAC